MKLPRKQLLQLAANAGAPPFLLVAALFALTAKSNVARAQVSPA